MTFTISEHGHVEKPVNGWGCGVSETKQQFETKSLLLNTVYSFGSNVIVKDRG